MTGPPPQSGPRTGMTSEESGETFFEIALKRTNTLYNSARDTVLKRSGTIYEGAREGLNEGLKRSGTIYEGARENVTTGLKRSGTIVGEAKDGMLKRAGTFTQSLQEGEEDPELGGRKPGMLQRTGTLMEQTRSQALKRTGTLLQDAQAYAKVIYNPGAPLKVSIREVLGADIPRVGHSVSVIDGRAYIFGGSDPVTKEAADNSMTVVILPSSGVHEADYKTVIARPAKKDGLLPEARSGHSACVIGEKIYVFGGRLSAKAKQEAAGRVWAFDIFTCRWSCLDPASDAALPQARSNHTSAASEQPGPPLDATKTAYKSDDEILKDEAKDAGVHILSKDSFGTFFVYGGFANSLSGEADHETATPLNDVWAFDVARCSWMALPSPSSPYKLGTTLVLSDTHLFSVGTGTSTTLRPGASLQPSGTLQISHLNIVDLLKPRTRASLPAQLALPSLLTEWARCDLSSSSSTTTTNPLPSQSSYFTAQKITSGSGYQYILVVAERGQMLALEVTPAATDGMRISGAEGPEIEDDDGTARVVKQVLGVEGRYVDTYGEVVVQQEVRGKLRLGGGFAACRGSQVEESHVVVWGGEGVRSGWMIALDL